MSLYFVDATTEKDIQRLLAEQFDVYRRLKKKVVSLEIKRYDPGELITYKIITDE